MNPAHAATLAAVVLAAAAAALVIAGPLNPPAGPVTSTYKTLADIEPRTAVNAANTPGDDDASPSLFKITQPGSYYLTGNITGVAGKIGIEVASGGVTLDLGGFELAGVPDSADAIRVGAFASGHRNVEVRNGSIRGWGGNGVNAASNYVCNCIFSNLRVLECSSGMTVSYNSVVRDCVAMENTFRGFQIGQGSTVSGCAARENGNDGFAMDADTVVTNCIATENATDGFSCGYGGVTMTNCHSADNGFRGFVVYVPPAYTAATTITACTAKSNARDGIVGSNGTTIVNCTASANRSHGIVVYGNCIVRGSTCETNRASDDGAGIRAHGTGNRIEDNNCAFNRTGIWALNTDNFIARNTARGNSLANFNVAAGNELAPVITNPGTSGFATMTPWSNVAY